MPTPFPDADDVPSPRNKLMSAGEAVRRFVNDGDTIYAGYTQVPHALVFEIIRQGREHLEGIGASISMQMSHLILAGCVDRVRSGYIGGALRPGAITEKMKSGALQFEDYSNGAIAMMLMAGAYGLPFVPMKWFLGTDYLKPENQAHPGSYLGDQKWRVIESPFDGERFVALPAIKPDVTVMHFQRSDVYDNVRPSKRSCRRRSSAATRTAHWCPVPESARSCMLPGARTPPRCPASTTTITPSSPLRARAPPNRPTGTPSAPSGSTLSPPAPTTSPISRTALARPGWTTCAPYSRSSYWPRSTMASRRSCPGPPDNAEPLKGPRWPTSTRYKN